MNRWLIASFVSLVSLMLTLTCRAAETVAIERIHPNKILYLFNETATAQIALKNTSDAPQKGELVATEEWDLLESRKVWSGPVELKPGEAKTVSFQWNVGNIMYGRALRVAFTQAGKTVAKGVEFYQVADPKDWFRCFLINGGGGADQETMKTDPFVTYGNFDNHFAYMLSGFSHLAPQEDEWVGGQFTVRWNKKEMIERIRARQALGIRAGAYTIGATGGPAGYEFARQHPDWMLRNKKGAFLLSWDSPVSPVEVARKTTEPLTTWYALAPDLGNPDVVQYGAEEIVRAIKVFGWDSVFFDGIYSVLPDAPGYPFGYTWDGQPSTRNTTADKLSVQCVRKVIEIIRKSYPNISLWYNGSGPRPGDPLAEAHASSLQDLNCGTLFEIQGGQVANPNYHGHQWRNLYEIWVNERNQLQKAKGLNDPVLATGYMYNMDPVSVMTKEEFAATRDTWTTANHIGAFLIAARIHPCVLCSTGFRPAMQFMTRYSSLLWSRDVKWVKEPWKTINVESNREVWWEECVYTRETPAYKDTMIHLLNSPDEEDITFKAAKDPEAAKYVEVELITDGDPKKVQACALQMYGYDSNQREPTIVPLKTEIDGRKVIVEVPQFKYHTLIVFRQKK